MLRYANLLVASSLALLLANRPVRAATVTITAAPSLPTGEPQWIDDDKFASAILNSTNFYRGEHNASSVTWNDTLAKFAADYLAQGSCIFKHSGGPYGENLAIGYPNATASVEAWGNERRDYDFGKPGFSEKTGHFTQLVWRNTTTVGCGRRLCMGTSGWFLACEYWPRGNVIGQFDTQVDAPVKGNAGVSWQRPGSGSWLAFVLAVLWLIL